jgi:chromosome segregation ATPase
VTQSGSDDRVSVPANVYERLARVEEQVPALDRHMTQRFDDLDKATALLARQQARTEDRLAKEADDQRLRDERNAKRAQELSNEWRSTVTDLAAGKADVGAITSLRSELSAKIEGIEGTLSGKIDLLVTAIGELRTDVGSLRSSGEGVATGRNAVLAIIGVGLAVAAFFLGRGG